MSYFPLDRDVLTSSVWAQGTPEQLKVWFYLLLTADPRTGVVEDAAPAVALRCGLPLDVTLAALEWLGTPDPHSRTKDHEGRRVEALPDGGFLVLNYLSRKDKDYSTPRVRRWRERKQTETVKRVSAVTGTTNKNKNKNKNKEPTETENDLVALAHDGGAPAHDLSEAVERVFEAWKGRTGRRRAVLTPQRRKHLLARLREEPGDVAAKIAGLERAVEGAVGDPFFNGVEKGRSYLGFENIFVHQGRDRIEKLQRLAESPERARGDSRADRIDRKVQEGLERARQADLVRSALGPGEDR